MNIRTSRALLMVSFLWNVGCGQDEAVTPHGAAGSSGTDGSAGVDTGGAGPGPLFGERVPVSETVSISGVSAPVDIVRDRYGMVHIYARSLEDVMFAQGYMMAVDRHGQLELLRRVAAGRLAELVGALSADQIDDDITMRTIGLQRTADQIYQQMEAGSLPKRVVDAFAKGISAWIANLKAGKVQRNDEFVGFDTDAFTPWKPEESIAMGRVQSWNLSYDADFDISLTDRWNQAQATFTAQNPDPDIAKRAGYMKDMMRFEPVDPTERLHWRARPTTRRSRGSPGPALAGRLPQREATSPASRA
jgi:penicillin amidase